MIQESPLGILNKDSELLTCNNVWAELWGRSTPEKVRGQHYSQQNSNSAEHADQFVKQDQIVFSEKRDLDFLTYSKYADGEYHAFLGSKKFTHYEGNDFSSGSTADGYIKLVISFLK